MEQRKEPRASVSFPVACNALTHRNHFYTVCKDLSANGIKIITDTFLPKGNSLKINVDLIDRAISLTATVMWCAKQRYAERYYAGLHFAEMNNADRKHLARFLTSTDMPAQ